MSTHPSVSANPAAGAAAVGVGPIDAQTRGSWYLGLVRRLAVAAGGVGVFVLVASVVDPQLSPADSATRPHEAAPVLSTPERDRVSAALAARPHPLGWPLVGVLEGAEYTTLAHASPDGPVYTVCSPDGRVLLADLPADDVYRAFPTLDLTGMRLDPAQTGAGPSDGPLMLAEPRVQPLD